MAGNQVTLTFAGEVKPSLGTSFDRVGSGARGMADDVDHASDRFRRVGDSADTLDTRAMGMRDTFTGVQDTFQAFNKEGASLQERALLLGMGMGDLASGVANFGTQFAKQVANFVAGGARMVASMATTVASTVAGWVTMGLQAMLNAAKMAVAWLISLGPIALVILAIGAVIGILAFLGVGFDDIRNVAEAVWGFILGAIQGVWNWVSENWPLLLAIITGPIGLAVLAIVKHKDTIVDAFRAAFDFVKNAATGAKDWIVDKFNAVVSFFAGLPGRIGDIFSGLGSSIMNGIKAVWNNSIGGFGFSVPSWVPGVGGREFRIPRLHQGGLMPGAPGTEGLALLQAGERVTPAGRAGGVTVVIHNAGSVITSRELVGQVMDAIRNGGGRGVL